ncbi:hypothetical protein [Polynucleobacter sp. UB-Raua-W9]|uniref:hypothetical protein n=1 Tax=Polynucleobacter sp. UB-Raua-W9 TaxID=1819736 RepID=UPI001BFEEB3B|nr:hypothetical protein [Polynucleobacter sp. UB-Raua-W9]QWD71794.1 hypothetical protein AOC07_05910 [Polynucleobacter sp. UB-Raua-W9]
MSSQEVLETLTNKSVLSFSSMRLWPLHTEMELAIMDYLSKNKNRVTMLVCNKAFKICKLNQDSDVRKCDGCISYSNATFQKISHRIKKLDFIFETIETAYNNLGLSFPTVNDIDQLTQLKYKNFECGKAIYSTLIDYYTKDLDVTKPSIFAKIQMYYVLSICFYESVTELIKTGKYDYGLVFNGRHPYEAAFIQAFKDLNLDYATHERGTSPLKIGLFPNRLPHHWKNDARNALNDKSDIYSRKDIEDIRNYLDHPLRSMPGVSFTNMQKKGEFIPETSKQIITLFLSTEDENVSIQDQEMSPKFSQVISRLILNFQLKDFDKYLLIIRDHPNSAFNLQEETYKNLSSPFDNVLYFSPTSSIDTYECMKKSELVITLGSATGLEAMNLGKKVVCLIDYSLYSANLPGVLLYQPITDDPNKLLEFINSIVPEERIRESAYRFVASLMSNDISIKGWQPYLGGSKKEYELDSKYILQENY